MYFKRLLTAMCALAVCASCGSVPWRNEPTGEEVNLAFTVENNLLVISSAAIGGRSGRFIVGAAEARTVVDATFARSLPAAVQGHLALEISEKRALAFTPVIADLRGAADAILGADLWGNGAITLDYHAGLLTYQKEGIHADGLTIYRFGAEPRINVSVDGRTISPVVDTTSPDTLVLPRGAAPAHRATARISIAGSDLGAVDIAFGDVATPRIGNRLLSKFLVTIDYGRREVGLWRDPRTP